MGKLSQTYAHNAGARDPSKPRIVTYKGARKNRKGESPPPDGIRRKHLHPSGKVERFVNLQGSVVEIPLVPSGVPPTDEAVASARARLHKLRSPDGDVEGFIEHGRCPIRHGTRQLSEMISAEFANMPQNLQAPCKEDPVTWRKTSKGIEYFDACPHIEWLIDFRRAKHSERTNARRFKQKTALQMEQEKVDLMKQQSEAATKILERVVEVVTKPAKKAPIE